MTILFTLSVQNPTYSYSHISKISKISLFTQSDSKYRVIEQWSASEKLTQCLTEKHSALNNNVLLVMSFGCLVEKYYNFSVIEESMNMLDTRCLVPNSLF